MLQKESYKKIENRKQKKDTCYKKIFHENKNSSKVEVIERQNQGEKQSIFAYLKQNKLI